MAKYIQKDDVPKLLYNQDAEECIIGSLLIDPTCFDDIAAVVGPDDFYLDRTAWVFSAIVALRARGEPLDPMTVADELEGRGQLAEIGGVPYLSDLEAVTPTAMHAVAYARIVRDNAQRRALIAVASEMAKSAYDPQRGVVQAITSAREHMDRLLRHACAKVSCSSWADIDRVLGSAIWDWPGWLAHGFATLLVSEPGQGKSSLALRLAACYLRGDTWPDGTRFASEIGAVLWCATEASQAVNLDLAKSWDLPLDKIITPFPNPLVDVSFAEPNHQAAIASAAQRNDVRLIVVDSLGSGTQDNNRDNEIGQLMKWLSRCARDTGKAMLVNYHLPKDIVFDVSDNVGLEQVSGNAAVVKFARVVWLIDSPDSGRPDIKRLAVVKSNLGRCAQPIGLKISDAGVEFCAAPDAPKQVTAMDKTSV